MNGTNKKHLEVGANADASGTPVSKSARDEGAVINKSLRLPHERDQSTDAVAPEPQDVILQAKKDLDAGQVDTDLRATPGLDAAQREAMVPTPVRPPSPDECTEAAHKRKP